ncbi:conserved hypothetical protein [Neospora caninum Liverpool]|uniref:Uncharacterized protein n=1 Tax=Neospora caninum (strain Liverpool) TaxID=572307 RepID=F0VI14_NEOCL|nr:conserved hypothetical protein [Neospora caninum Liverpool]CBZ53375.1 conserved hypothetical protein [Neospora caninum Liverpool]|eukprot:XP_003883407.1 conserved hypothetical protein [Neospora caninum Liverpool]
MDFCLLRASYGNDILAQPTEETVETVEFSDGLLTPEEEQEAHYPFVDAPMNLLIDPAPLRKEMGARQRRRLSLLRRIADSALSPEALHAPHAPPKADSGNAEETAAADGGVERPEVDPEPPDVRTDLVELDRFYPGLGPWPSTALLQRLNATYDRLPGTLHEDSNPQLHYRTEVKTIAEAQLEFERWRPRMGLDRLYWVLEADEEAQLPDRFRKRYKAVRRQLLPPPRQQFANWLGENYVSPDEPLPEVGIPEEEEEHAVTPFMLRFMESSYTYTPPLSPIDGEVDMYDDPPDAPWRRRVESKIRRAVEWGFPERVRPYRTGFTTYDISWYAGVLDVVVMILPGPSPPAAKILSLQDLKRFRQLLGDMLEELEDKEQLYVTKNHQVVVSSLPFGAERRLLCCRKDFNLFAGSECTFVFDRDASAILNPISDEETAALLLDECAQTVSSARQNLLPHEKALFPQDFSLKTDAAVRAEALRELHAAVAASALDGPPTPARDGAGKEGSREEKGNPGERGVGAATAKDRGHFLAEFLGRKGEILQGYLLGSPNPAVMVIAVGGKVCFVSHDHVKKVYRASPVVSPWSSRSSAVDGDFTLRSSFESPRSERRGRFASPLEPPDGRGARARGRKAPAGSSGAASGRSLVSREDEAEAEDAGDTRDLFDSGRSAGVHEEEGDAFDVEDEVPDGEDFGDPEEASPFERPDEAEETRDEFDEPDYDAYEEGSDDEE